MVLAAAIILTASFTLLQEPIGRLLARGGLTVGDDALLRVQRPLTVVAGLLIGALVTISSVGAGVIGMMILLLLYPRQRDRKSVVSGKSVSVRVDLGGRRIIKKTT